jgi:CheY-like chemotaxis protein
VIFQLFYKTPFKPGGVFVYSLRSAGISFSQDYNMKQLNVKPKGVFVFVDENKDMHKLLKRSLKELKLDNQVVICYNGEEALNYLKDTEDKIFMILSEVTMPRIDGLELKRMIELAPELKVKAIPFFYLTEVILDAVVKTAYSFGIQGYFKKGDDVQTTTEILTYIFNFWTYCLHPKNLR